MADESYSFSTARTRLEAIVTQVRKKDTSLEKSLDLLEEGVRLANACTELIDHADWVAAGATPPESAEADETRADASEPSDDAESEVEEGSGDPADEARADEAPAEAPAEVSEADVDSSADER
jgi:exodeoxyribonuclease VII small subunit